VKAMAASRQATSARSSRCPRFTRVSAAPGQEIARLTEELAYDYWHRVLFARFLAENQLLMHPDGVAVSLAKCDEPV
jgi:hypothetical protein